MKYAFRCSNCGNLEDGANAGERTVPAACRICGAGVRFHPVTGAKEYDEGNWVVLADLPEAELAPILEFHGIEQKDVARHRPAKPAGDREPTSINRSASEAVGAEDRP